VVRTLSLLAGVAMLASCGSTPPSPGGTTPEALRGRVVFVGDSITAGEGVKTSEGFPALLASWSPEMHAQTEAISGLAVAEYRANLAVLLPAVPAEADTIVILLGTNDVLKAGTPEERADNAAAAMDAVLTALSGRAPRAKLVLMIPPRVFREALSPRMRDAGYAIGGPESLAVLADRYREIAERRGTGLVDLSGAIRPEETLDGVHPDRAGHRHAAEAIWRGLQ
jgi:acyl-CoA thioesterase-1